MADGTRNTVGASQKFIDLGGSVYAAATGTVMAFVEATPALTTDAYADGDLLFDSTEIANAVRTGSTAMLQSLAVIDSDDQSPALEIYLWSKSIDMGTVNSAVAVAADSDLVSFLGRVSVVAADWKDLGPGRVASIENIGLMVKADSGTSIYFGATTSDTPTHTASGLLFKFGFTQ